MEAITQLLNNPNAKETFLCLVVALVAFEFLVKLWDWFQKRFGIETANTKHEKEQSDQIKALKLEVGEIRDQQKAFLKTQNTIIDSISSMRQSLVEKEVDDMRWDMLDFANALMSGRCYNKEQFDHVLKVYSKYLRVVKENNMTNEQVDASMDFVKEKYQECLRDGFSSDNPNNIY